MVLSLECMLIVFARMCNMHRRFARYLRKQGKYVFKLFTKNVLLASTYTSHTSAYLQETNKNKVDVMIVNHISTVDFIVILDYLYDHGFSNYHFVLKKEIVCVPGIGQLMYFGENVIVQRNWRLDTKTIWNDLDSIPNGGLLILFPEGTRMSEEKLQASKKYCFDNGIPMYNHLLVPKTKGAWFILNYLKSQCRLGSLYDMTLHANNFQQKKNMFFSNILQGIGRVGFHIRKLDTSNLPVEHIPFQEWFRKIWKEKDQLFERVF